MTTSSICLDNIYIYSSQYEYVSPLCLQFYTRHNLKSPRKPIRKKAAKNTLELVRAQVKQVALHHHTGHETLPLLTGVSPQPRGHRDAGHSDIVHTRLSSQNQWQSNSTWPQISILIGLALSSPAAAVNSMPSKDIQTSCSAAPGHGVPIGGTGLGAVAKCQTAPLVLLWGCGARHNAPDPLG